MSARKLEVLYREGKRGYTVSLVVRADREGFWLRWWEGTRRNGKGDYAWRQLGVPLDEPDPRAYAEQKCRELASLLLSTGSAEKSGADAPLTVAELLALYQKHRTSRKKDRQAAADKRWSRYWIDFLSPAREALTIDPDTVEAYIQWRRDQGVSDTTIGHEIVFLRGVMDWAISKRMATGKPLLLFNPIAKVERIRSTDPKTPVADPRTFRLIYRYSDKVDRQKFLRCFLMLAHEHGWRLSAWRKLWASDIDLHPWQDPVTGVVWPYGRIRKRPENDKKGKGRWVPLTPRSRSAALRLLRRSAAIGDTYLFRAPKAGGPWQEQHALDLLHRTEDYANRKCRARWSEWEDVELGGFHALRRKWGTDRKDQPIADVAESGDWAPATLLGHYQKADAETTLRVTMGGRKG